MADSVRRSHPASHVYYLSWRQIAWHYRSFLLHLADSVGQTQRGNRTGENGLLKQPSKLLVEKALEAEMADHLERGKHEPAGFSNRMASLDVPCSADVNQLAGVALSSRARTLSNPASTSSESRSISGSSTDADATAHEQNSVIVVARSGESVFVASPDSIRGRSPTAARKRLMPLEEIGMDDMFKFYRIAANFHRKNIHSDRTEAARDKLSTTKSNTVPG